MKKPLSIILLAALMMIVSLPAATGERGMVTIQFVFNPESYPWMMGKKYPQLAVWAHDPVTGKKETIFVTSSAAKNKWVFAASRPDSLPVWYGIRGAEAVDTVTSATPGGKAHTIKWKIPSWARGKIIDFYIEANISFDYNERYAKNLPASHPNFSGENGQPSAIWYAILNLASPDAVEPELLGHGHVTGKDSHIIRDLSGLTTAKKLFHHLHLTSAP